MRLINGIDLTIQLATCKASLIGESEWITGYRDGLTAAFDLLAKAPTIEAKPVVHGEWEPSPHLYGYVQCSVCHDCHVWDEWRDGKKWGWCPNCGAKLDGGKET